MVPGEDRIILHFDMDAYFASCEELRNPQARGRALIVGGAPRAGEARGVVVAANYAARALGVRSAMPIREAWRRAPNAVYVPPDHAHYVDVSRRLFNDLRASFALEQASIDEAYLDVTQLESWSGVAGFAAKLRDRILRATGGLHCSIGIGPNKLVAKIATDFRKPKGVTIVAPEDVPAFLDPLPVAKIPGVGPKTTQRLSLLGIERIQQLREWDRHDLREAFGDHGLSLQKAAAGLDEDPVHPIGRLRKSISEEHTFIQDTRDRLQLLASVRRMVSSLERDLRRRNYWYRSVALKVRFADFSTRTRQAALSRASPDTTGARRLLPHLLGDFLKDPRPVRLIGVRFGDLAQPDGQRVLTEFAA